MKSLREQTEAQIERTRQAKPEFMKSLDDLIASAHAFGQGDDAVAVGQRAPSFELPDPNGGLVALAKLLDLGPVVVTFYRGGWCPYCNLQLRALQECLPQIHSLGAQLVAISPQMPDESLTQTERDALKFHVLSDQDALVAKSYGVAWEVPAFLLEHMRKDRNLDLAEINNGNGHILPMPATFVLGKDGVVAWRYVDIDYRQRSEPTDVIAALERLYAQ